MSSWYFLWDICDLRNPHGFLKVKYIACLFFWCTSCVFLGVVTCHRHLTIPWGYLPFADELDDPTEVCTAVLKDPLEQLGSSIGWIRDGLEPGNATVLLGGWIQKKCYFFMVFMCLLQYNIFYILAECLWLLSCFFWYIYHYYAFISADYLRCSGRFIFLITAIIYYH